MDDFDKLNKLYEFESPREYHVFDNFNSKKLLAENSEYRGKNHRLSLSHASFPISRTWDMPQKDVESTSAVIPALTDVSSSDKVQKFQMGTAATLKMTISPLISAKDCEELARRRALIRRTHSSIDQSSFSNNNYNKGKGNMGLRCNNTTSAAFKLTNQYYRKQQGFLPHSIPEEDTGITQLNIATFAKGDMTESSSNDFSVFDDEGTPPSSGFTGADSNDESQDINNTNFNFVVERKVRQEDRSSYNRNPNDNKSIETEPDTTTHETKSHEFKSDGIRGLKKNRYQIKPITQNETKADCVQIRAKDFPSMRGSLNHITSSHLDTNKINQKQLTRALTVMNIDSIPGEGFKFNASSKNNKTPSFYVNYDPITSQNILYSSNPGIYDVHSSNPKVASSNSNYNSDNSTKSSIKSRPAMGHSNVNSCEKLSFKRRLSYANTNNVSSLNSPFHRGSINSLQNWPLHSSPSLEKLYLLT